MLHQSIVLLKKQSVELAPRFIVVLEISWKINRTASAVFLIIGIKNHDSSKKIKIFDFSS